MPPTPTSNAVLLERIENVIKKVDALASDIKCNAADFTKFAKEYEGSHTLVVESDKQAHKRIDDLNKRMDAFDEAMKKLADSIHPLIFTNKILTWLAVLLGSSIVALIWSILTHTVELVTP